MKMNSEWESTNEQQKKNISRECFPATRETLLNLNET